MRNQWLIMSDEALVAECDLEFFKGSGNGGQKRNKTSSAARVRHRPTGLAAEDCTERSQHLNRHSALKKLRQIIAFTLRETPAPLPRPEVSPLHSDYPLWTAIVLDHLAAANWNPAPAAITLGFSTSRLIKLLYRDPALWQQVNSHRQAPLKG